MPALLMGSASCLRGNVPPVPIRLVAYAMGPSCPGAAMSEEWPNGWYRDEQGRQAQPGFTPRQDAQGSPDEPTQAGPPGGTAWPIQPAAHSWPGDGGPPRTRRPRAGGRGWGSSGS